MSDKSDFNVAFAAAILAAAAFVVAFFQALLQYISSGNARYKCTEAAIGQSYRLVTWRPSRDWKLRVSYPQLDLDHHRLWELGATRDTQRGTYDFWGDTMERMKLDGVWRCVNVGSKDKVSRWTLGTSLDVICIRNANGDLEPFSFFKLDWRGKLLFFKFRYKYPWRPLQLPRASWSQLLLALGIQDSKPLLLRLVDADTVHENLDAPTQRVNLKSLGLLAFRLGFTTVEMNAERREFKALSPHGSITTQEIPALGKVLKFDGNILEIRQMINRNVRHWCTRSSSLVMGQLSFGVLSTNGLCAPLSVLAKAISENWTSSKYDAAEKEFLLENATSEGFSAGPLLKEARVFTQVLESETERIEILPEIETSRNIHTELTTEWFNASGCAVPTTYAATMFCTVSAIVCGYPWRKTLMPFLPWLKQRARVLAQSPLLKESKELYDTLLRDQLDFTSLTTEYFMDGPDYMQHCGLFGWGCSYLSKYYTTVPESIKSEIGPTEDDTGIYALCTRPTLKLLADFDCHQWSGLIKVEVDECMSYLRPQNLLWAQIMILDMAIQILIHGGVQELRLSKHAAVEQQLKMLTKVDRVDTALAKAVDEEQPPHWNPKEIAVVNAIVRFWRPGDTETEDPDSNDSSIQPGENATQTPKDEGLAVPGNNLDSPLTEAESLGISSSSTVISGNDESSGVELPKPSSPEQAKQASAKVSSPKIPRAMTLAECILESPTIFENDSKDLRRDKSKQLADLLEIRALFCIAFLFLHPDSTDVYMSEGYDIEMSMA